MTILIEHYFDHRSAVEMDECARRYLLARSVAAKCVPSARGSEINLADYSMLITRGPLPDELRAKTNCLGGRKLSRIENLDYVRRVGLPQMQWAAAESADHVDALFDRWNTDQLILKRSDSWKSRGLRMFARDELEALEWDPQRDLFCPEVNREDGTVGKVECLGGRQLFTWLYLLPPVRTVIADGVVDPKPYVTAPRIPNIQFPESLLAKARECSELATRDGIGHISIDFMRAPDGAWTVIELNTQEVSLWWTSQFDIMLQNYALAVHALAARFE